MVLRVVCLKRRNVLAEVLVSFCGRKIGFQKIMEAERLYDMMKKFISILLGSIVVVSFALTGCQSGVELETKTIDIVSSTVMGSGVAQSKGSISVNNDKNADESEYSSSVMTESAVTQSIDEIGINQQGKIVSDLKITAEGVPVEVRLASDGQYSYEI